MMAVSDLQPLPSSLREKHRYLIYEVLSEEDHGFGAIVGTYWEALLNLLGEAGVAQADPWIMKDLFDEKQQRGGIRVNKDKVAETRAALAVITEIEDVPVTVQVLGVTGTMKSARDKYL